MSGSPVSISEYRGEIVAVRTADDPDLCARLRREASILRRLRIPGVVALVDHLEDPPSALRTRFVGPDSWRDHPPSGADVSPALASLASVLADVHEAGVVHRRLDPSHVLTGDGGPVLCGFAEASIDGEDAADVDIAAFVAMGRTLLAGADDPDHIDGVLLDLEAGHLDLRTVSETLGRRRLRPAGPPPRRRTLRPTRAATLAAAGLALLPVALLVRFHGGSGPTHPRSPEDATTAPAATAPLLEPRDPPAAGAASADPLPASSAHLELVHDARRFLVGRRGDQVVTGDWNCNGTATPAVLRPETGEVAVFDRWPEAGVTIEPSRLVVVEGAIALNAEGVRCPALRISTPMGSRLLTIDG